MKTSTLLFFGAFLAMFAYDYLFSYLPKTEFIASGTEHPYVQEVLSSLEQPIDATSSPVEERRYSVGYIRRASVMPGIRLVHDPSLGKEILATGPAAALDVLIFKAKEGRLSPDFTKLVKLNDLVEVRANLQAHGSDRMRINLQRPERRTALQAEFTTAGPLTFRILELINFGEQKVDVAVENLVVWSHNSLDNIHGTAGRFEILISDDNEAVTAPSLAIGETIRTNIQETVKGPPATSTPEVIIDSLVVDTLNSTIE